MSNFSNFSGVPAPFSVPPASLPPSLACAPCPVCIPWGLTQRYAVLGVGSAMAGAIVSLLTVSMFIKYCNKPGVRRISRFRLANEPIPEEEEQT